MKVRTTEMEFSRRLARIRRTVKIKNSRVCEIRKAKHNVQQTIKHNMLRWYEYVFRMKEEHIPKILLE